MQTSATIIGHACTCNSIYVYFYVTGGLGDCVAGEVSECPDICVKKLAVTKVPRSGKPAELMEMFGISANCIVKAVHKMLSATK